MVLIDTHAKMRSEDDFNTLYPEPPQGPFSSAPSVELLSPEAFAYQRPGQDCFVASTGMETAVMYAEAPYNHLFHGNMSPHMYTDDGDMQGLSSNMSTASIPSAPSSDHGSPRSSHGQPGPLPGWSAPHGLGVSPGIVGQHEYFAMGTEYSYAPQDDYPAAFAEFAQPKPGFVDPSILHPPHDVRQLGVPGFETAYPPPPGSQYTGSPAMTSSPQLRHGSTSPFVAPNSYQHLGPFGAPMDQGRRPSMGSFHSGYSHEQHYSDGESKEKQKCPHPDCGKTFKDLRAHMLTHQNERPEKCPITTCDYHTKGFARKYDKNRHTLTHYKGTMVCGFCPGSGSAAEKSFNRADVFKRHLTAVHGVEQSAPNSRKKTGAAATSSGPKKLTGYAPDATGKCSTCTATFSNAQDFYEHLDDCVLRIVQLEDPAEAVNAKRLAEVENDREVHATLEKNHLPTATQTNTTDATPDEDEDEEMDPEEEADDDSKGLTSPRRAGARINPVNGVQKSRGLTHSRGGVPLVGKSRGRKNRRDYPSSWGFDKGQMTMKKRVMAVFDGPRRLAKDDMMLSTDHEVRLKLSDGKAYVTDLDVQSMKRAQGFLNATDEEKGPWLSDDPSDEQLQQMHKMQQEAAGLA